MSCFMLSQLDLDWDGNRAGICPGTALGFFWALGGTSNLHHDRSDLLTCFCLAAAERRELFRFSADLGKLALRIADQYGSSFEKW